MLKIRLSLRGKKGQHSFHVVVIDSRKKRDSGNYVADLGFYNPHTKEMKVNREEVKKWLDCGAQPTLTVQHLLKNQPTL